MNLGSILILAVILVWFVISVIWMGKGSHGDCGSCDGCMKHCDKNKKTRDHK
jgi:hypothetical protein